MSTAWPATELSVLKTPGNAAVGTPSRATNRWRAEMLIPMILAIFVLHPRVMGARSLSELTEVSAKVYE